VVTFVFPAGTQQGQTIEATINGRDFQNANGVRITGPGVTASIVEVVNPNAVRISLAAAPDSELGERDLRLITPGGISNRVRFFIGALPEVNEVEPNTDRAQPQALSALPILVNGQILDNDRDHYRFSATAGQTIVADVQARTLLAYLSDTVPGFLDACLTLFDPGGKALASVDRFRHQPDPVLAYTIPQDGEYTLEVSDVIYRGRGDFVYRLSIGAFPYLTHVFPLGGQRNSTAQIELDGMSLPAPTMDFPVPADSPSLRFVGPVAGALPTNALPLAVGDEPEVRETEPNDELAQANRVGVPAAINGRIQQPGDVDHFLLTAEANQVLVLDVRARRLDSPLDSFLTIMNAQGGVYAENDDFVDPDYPLLLHHSDSRLAFTFPAAGDYILRVRDTQGKGGDEYAYRLVVAPPKPDCVLRVIPDMQRVAKGDSVVVTVTADRRDGFGGEINLAVENLPTGFTASDAIIPAGQPQAKLTITAPPDAPSNVFSPAIVGTTTLNEQPFTRTAFGAEDVMQAFSYRHVVPTREFVVAVIEMSLFGLSTDAPPQAGLEIKQGAEAQVVVKATRQEGATFPINLAVVDAPVGITVKTAPIPADQNEVAITLSVPAEAPAGWKVNVILNGTMSTGQATATRTAPAIPIKIVPAQ
ncbi:MAG: PPC domain-containing protein, partial [Planctomycetota bacterium]